MITKQMNNEKKRIYHDWRMPEKRFLTENYRYFSDRELGKIFGTTEDAVEIQRRRMGLRRPMPFHYFSPGQMALQFASVSTKPEPTIKKHRKQSKTDLFLQIEEKYKAPTLKLIEEIKPLALQSKNEEVAQKLDALPFEQYDYMLEKCDPPRKSLRDCLSATLRWLFRKIEIDPGHDTSQDLRLLTKTMDRRCNYC